VSNLTSANLTDVICLTWNAPFTLDITGVDPDISYCVNISVGAVVDSNDTSPLTSNCSIYIPKFNFTMNYPNTSTSVIYEFQVTPRNGAGDGPTSAPVYGFFRGCELILRIVLFQKNSRTDWFGHITLLNGTTCACHCIYSVFLVTRNFLWEELHGKYTSWYTLEYKKFM